MEWIISGYCRKQDQARTVLLELDEGEWYWDCEYPRCPHSVNCPIGPQIEEKKKEATP